MEKYKKELDKLVEAYGNLMNAKVIIRNIEEYLRNEGYTNELGTPIASHKYLLDAIDKAYAEMFAEHL